MQHDRTATTTVRTGLDPRSRAHRNRWARNVFGAGFDFELVSSVSDADAVELLRSIQRKLAFKADADLLFSDAGRPRRPFDFDAWEAKNGPSG